MPGRPRAVLLSLAVRPAGRACACKHDSRHRIARGELRLIVKNPGPASGESGYCITCAQHMLALARAELDQHSRNLAHAGEEPPERAEDPVTVNREGQPNRSLVERLRDAVTALPKVAITGRAGHQSVACRSGPNGGGPAWMAWRSGGRKTKPPA